MIRGDDNGYPWMWCRSPRRFHQKAKRRGRRGL